MTHFERLDLPQRYGLDPAELERRYLDRSRAVHPDHHQLAPTSQQQASLALTAGLNEAYTVLRHPFRRAEYLLGLEGGPSAAEHKDMDPAFLEEMLELRMEIEEIRMEGGHDSPARLRMEEQLERREDRLAGDIAAAFARLEEAPAGERQQTLVQVRRLLNTVRYIEGLLRDLRAD